MKKNKVTDIDIGEIKISKYKKSKEIIISNIINGEYDDLIKNKIDEPKHIRLVYHTDIKPKEVRYFSINKYMLDTCVFKKDEEEE